MAMSITETMQPIAPMETLQMKQNASPNIVPKPPTGPKPVKNNFRLDPLRALEPARKKLSTLEAQRIMAVLVESIKKIEVVTCLPYILENLERFRVSFGSDIVHLLENHIVIISSFEELKSEAQRLLQSDSNDAARADEINQKAEAALKNLQHVAKQMQNSCKNILRAFTANPSAITTVLKDQQDRSEPALDLIFEMKELKEIIMGMLLTTPVEESERNQYLKQVSERERKNAQIIEKLESDLALAQDDKDGEIKKKNEVIRRLQADLHQIEKFSEEHIRRTKTEAEKQESADMKNSEGKKVKLQQETGQFRNQLSTLILEHRESEGELRKKKFKFETEVENWIQKYDQDMGERQDEFEEIDAVYTEEKKQLNELEERFKTLETEYKQIMEERRIARERREAAERELQMCIKAATTIQAFWRSFKVRKALKSKKKKKGGKKGKK